MRTVIKFKAVICLDFYERWLIATAKHENMTLDETTFHYGGRDLMRLSNQNSGLEVDMIKCDYPIGETDYFIESDDNFVIHKELFEVV